jgi:hypothetical protein
MKKLLVVLLSLITLNTQAQDGLCAWVKVDSVDVMVSIYNSDPNCRPDLCKYIYNRAIDERLSQRPYNIMLADNVLVLGEMFITRGDKYMLCTFYVDRILYPNGTTYEHKRYEKPSLDDN